MPLLLVTRLSWGQPIPSMPCSPVVQGLWGHTPSWGPSWGMGCVISSDECLKVPGTVPKLCKLPSPTGLPGPILGRNKCEFGAVFLFLLRGCSHSRKQRHCLHTSSRRLIQTMLEAEIQMFWDVRRLHLGHICDLCIWPFLSVFLAERVHFSYDFISQRKKVVIVWFLKNWKRCNARPCSGGGPLPGSHCGWEPRLTRLCGRLAGDSTVWQTGSWAFIMRSFNMFSNAVFLSNLTFP